MDMPRVPRFTARQISKKMPEMTDTHQRKHCIEIVEKEITLVVCLGPFHRHSCTRRQLTGKLSIVTCTSPMTNPQHQLSNQIHHLASVLVSKVANGSGK